MLSVVLLLSTCRLSKIHQWKNAAVLINEKHEVCQHWHTLPHRYLTQFIVSACKGHVLDHLATDEWLESASPDEQTYL